MFWQWPWNHFRPPPAIRESLEAYCADCTVSTQRQPCDFGPVAALQIEVLKGFINRMPPDWLPEPMRGDFLAWWSSPDRQQRIDAIKRGSPMTFVMISLSFACLPDGSRGESLNIGLAVFDQDKLDVRAGARLEKIRALSAAVDPSTVQEIIENLPNLDQKLRDTGLVSAEDRLRMLSRIGPVSLSLTGQFVADNASTYEARLSAIMKAMVIPEVAPKRFQHKRSRLLTQMKAAFRLEGVMTKRKTISVRIEFCPHIHSMKV